jgi:hypothetical protein
MSLCFVGPSGSVEHPWIAYALLRDNVQHYLEEGRPSRAFEATHSIADALGGGRVVLQARTLRGELERARKALAGRPIADLAIGPRTRGVIDHTWPPPGAGGTALLGDERGKIVPWLSPAAANLDQVFGPLIRSLLEITRESEEGDVVEVWDA